MKRWVRALCLAVALCLCTAYLPVCAENAPARQDGLVEVEFDMSCKVSPEKTILTGKVLYGDALFERPATEYNHPLAQATTALALSNFRRADLTEKEQGYGVRDFLTRIGFEDLQCDQYEIETTSDTVASTIGRKETVIGGEKCTILAVSVCGFGYKNEWLSNFTFSEGEQHEGFTSAADKVLSRVLLYLYNHPAEGRLKIWISGFSRAAAISNLVGQKLSSGKLLPVEDLYVYTFATPNTATVESPWPCPSIFNITGSFDLVPTIPPSEWGYLRYGTTLYLPAQEVVLDYAARRAAVQPIFKELTGIDYWNNPSVNWFLQKVFQVIYSHVNSSLEYNESIKDVVSKLWTAESMNQFIRTLSDMMKRNGKTDRSIRKIASDMRQVLSVFLYNYLYRDENGEGKYWGEGVAFKSQILCEHYPDVYYAWMMSQDDPEKLFIDAPGYRRIALPAGLTCDSLVWTEEDALASTEADMIATIRLGDETIYTVPMSRECVFVLRAEKKLDEGVGFSVNEYKVGSLKTRADLLLCEPMEKDELAYVYLPGADYPEESILYYTENSEEGRASAYTVDLDQQDETVAVLLEILDSGWVATHTVDILFALLMALLVGLIVIIVVVNTRVLGRKKYFRARRAFLTILFIFFLLEQLVVNYYPWGRDLIALCKGVCSGSIVGICVCALYRRRSVMEWLVLVASVFCAIGDVAINTSMLAGVILFGLGHVALLIAFLSAKKPRVKQIVLIAVLLVLLLPLEYLFRSHFPKIIVPIMVYTVLVVSMAVLSSQYSKGVMAGGILFAVSDFLLGVKIVTGTPPLLAFVSLFVYYLAVAILASAVYKDSRTKPLSGAHDDKPGTVLI